MPLRLEDLTERIELAKSFEDLMSIIWSLREAFGVEHVVYHSVNRVGEPFALATYSAEWAKYYEENTLYRIDPVVTAAFQRFHPYEWKSLDWETKSARSLYADAVSAGVGNQGLSLPIRGPSGEFALFSVSHQCDDIRWISFIEENRSNLLLVGHYLHQAARRIDEVDAAETFAFLSPRESDALKLLGCGHNRARIAEKLEISEHTLRVYIESARFKLGATNTVHAVAKAVSKGLIAL